MLQPDEGFFRRQRRVLLLLLLVPIAGIAAVDFVLDPFSAYRVVPVPGLHGYRTEMESRVARGELLEHGGCGVAIVGTSRAQIAIDPEHPAWGRPGCNLAVTGAGIREIEELVQSVLRHPEVRELFWTLDFLSFDTRTRPHPDFLHSRFNRKLDRFEYHAGLLLGGNALRASWRLLQDYKAGRPSPYSELGLTDPSLDVREHEYRERFLWSLARDVGPLARPGGFVYDAGAAREVVELAEQAQRDGRRVTLVLLPSHALHWEVLDRFGRWEDFERWKRDLAGALGSGDGTAPPLWDCTGYTDASMERVPPPGDRTTRMRWHWDSAHVTRELGDAVVDQVRGTGESLVGPCLALGSRSLADVLARIRAGQQRYRAGSAADQRSLIDVARDRAVGVATAQNR